MPRIEIGVGAIIAAIAGLGWGSHQSVDIALFVFGVILTVQGIYGVYYKPNVGLNKTLIRWLRRRDWKVTPLDDPTKVQFHFAFWAEDDAKRRVLISRGRESDRIIAFTAPISLDQKTIDQVGKNLSTTQQQLLYAEIQVLLASMHLGYISEYLPNISVQHALPIDDQLSEHFVDLKAKEVVDGVIVARSAIQKAIIQRALDAGQAVG